LKHATFKPAVVSEDGEVSFGKVKRGNREITITSKAGQQKKYLVPLSKQILVQENDYVKAGTPLSDGAITPSDILAIKGPTKVQEYIVNEVQEVYRLQGVKINDKHFEVIVRQMMRKVEIIDPGNTKFLEKQLVDKWEFFEENDWICLKIITDRRFRHLKQDRRPRPREHAETRTETLKSMDAIQPLPEFPECNQTKLYSRCTTRKRLVLTNLSCSGSPG
jgi:hypothetical protein